MPVVAVASVAWGGAALAAGATGFAAVAAMGAVVAGVGAVTGNSDLVKVGGVMGLVGGIGSLATSQGLITEAAAGESLAAEGAGAAAEGAPAMDAVVDTGAVSTDTLAQTGMETASAAPVDAASVAEGNSLLNQAPAAPDPAALAENSFDSGAMQDILGRNANSAPTLFEKLTGAGKNLNEWAQKNQLLASGIMQVGGKFVSGLFDPTKDAQSEYLRARVDETNAQTGLINQQAANISQRLPTAVTTGTRPVSPYLTGSPAYSAPILAR